MRPRGRAECGDASVRRRRAPVVATRTAGPTRGGADGVVRGGGWGDGSGAGRQRERLKTQRAEPRVAAEALGDGGWRPPHQGSGRQHDVASTGRQPRAEWSAGADGAAEPARGGYACAWRRRRQSRTRPRRRSRESKPHAPKSSPPGRLGRRRISTADGVAHGGGRRCRGRCTSRASRARCPIAFPASPRYGNGKNLSIVFSVSIVCGRLN
ncbi:hypothetical protein ZWY2020_002376 [Hordeum vulgare]|nr:hypothetical protein ZWY2020_002376 [Hordeum vulgare]